MPAHTGNRSAFTLIEVMISMTLMLFVLGIATSFFQRQGRLIGEQSGRLEAQQTAQFTLSELDRELRLAGVGVVDMQPILVQADAMAITFNADLVSSLENDPSAVYVDPDAPVALTSVFRSGDKRPLPLSTVQYPESTYFKSAGALSGAETISFWLSPDSSTLAANDYILWRRVNTSPPRIVATSVIRNAADTVFQYFQGDSAGNLKAVLKSKLPLYHSARVHGIKADSGVAAIIDSIHTVRVRVTVAFQGRKGPVLRRLDHTIRLMNAGLIRRSTCGEPPLGVTPTAAAVVDAQGQPTVSISWTRSGDEGLGEKDVERYALYRRPAGVAGPMEEPFASIPAGATSYSYVDTDVKSGEQWVYGVAAQDCTPSTSGVGVSSAVLVP